MNELWVISALVFGAAMFGVQAGYWFSSAVEKPASHQSQADTERPRRARTRFSRLAPRAQVQQYRKSIRSVLE